jgi:hypothetical protein
MPNSASRFEITSKPHIVKEISPTCRGPCTTDPFDALLALIGLLLKAEVSDKRLRASRDDRLATLPSLKVMTAASPILFCNSSF